jgi:hypothetical protein
MSYRFLPCKNRDPDCKIAVPPGLPAYEERLNSDTGEHMLQTIVGRVIGSICLAALVFLAIVWLTQAN